MGGASPQSPTKLHPWGNRRTLRWDIEQPQKNTTLDKIIYSFLKMSTELSQSTNDTYESYGIWQPNS